jgi:NAD-dependent SIR2 family protein deacetylase
MLRSGQTAPFTPFNSFAEDLAGSGHLRRHYTQNIDCRHTRLASLSQSTVWLHGQADTLVYHLNPSHTRKVTARSFRRWVIALCPSCKKEMKRRAITGKRRHTQGLLRPKVLLYREPCPNEAKITAAFKSDLAQPVDAVLIVGTRLLIPSLRQFAKHLCTAVRANDPGSLVVWVSKEPPKLGDRFNSLINFTFLGDCDDFASMMTR